MSRTLSLLADLRAVREVMHDLVESHHVNAFTSSAPADQVTALMREENDVVDALLGERGDVWPHDDLAVRFPAMPKRLDPDGLTVRECLLWLKFDMQRSARRALESTNRVPYTPDGWPVALLRPYADDDAVATLTLWSHRTELPYPRI